MNAIQTFFLTLLLLLNLGMLHAQPVQWASFVREVSSSYYSEESPRQYSPAQALGQPNKLPAAGNSPCAWSPALPEGKHEEFIWVGFDRPMPVRQVAVAESYHPGSISEVYIYSESDAEYRIYHEPAPQPAKETARMFRVMLDKKTNFAVASVRIVLKTERVKGWNHIDAIGISEGDTPIEARINVAESPRLEIERLPETINSNYDEVLPVISPDGKTLYFDRKNHPDNMLSLEDVTQPNDDIWVSRKRPSGAWSEAERMPTPLNNGSHNYVCSVSPDGNTLLLGNVYLPSGEVIGGVSVAQRTERGWSFPRSLKIRNYFNKHRYSEFFLAQDRKTLLLAIERDDSYGGRDLYVSFLDEDSAVWGEPVNLGSTLNSAGTELTPFLAADGKTLYFSSNGHSGYGSTDMFVSKRLDNTWQRWTRPINLGPQLNSENWDASYSIDANGEYAYFVSYGEAEKGADIFRAKLPEAIRPEPVLLLAGTVRDADTRKPLLARIRYTSTDSTGSGLAQSNPEDGKYQVTLPYGSRYAFTVSAKGYLNAYWTLQSDSNQQSHDFELQPIEVGKVIPLKHVLFEQGKDRILKRSFPELNQVFTLLEENPGMRIELAGHTDIEGSPVKNMKLSRMRVESIKAYLVSKGIAPERIETKPYGDTRPLTRARDKHSKQRNRRVEFQVVGYEK